MSLDKANSKLLVEIKKLHVPDDIPEPAPIIIDDPTKFDIINGGHVAPVVVPEPTPEPIADDPVNADGFDLC